LGVFLSFLPFIAFALLAEPIGPMLALAIGAAIGLVLAVRSRMTPPYALNVLDTGAAALMGGVALYLAAAGGTLSLIAVRLCVDFGLFLIVLISIAIGRPFTLAYARQQVDPAYWDHPLFLKTNNLIAGAWAAAFAVMAGIEAAMLFWPAFPRPLGVALILLAFAGAFSFTAWYPKRVRAAAAGG